LVILSGFTSESIDGDSSVFESNICKYVLLKPQTQIRAGATRPKAYIFSEE